MSRYRKTGRKEIHVNTKASENVHDEANDKLSIIQTNKG